MKPAAALVLLLAVAALLPPAAARSEIRVLDGTGAVHAVPVHGERLALLRWADDGTALLVRDGTRVLRAPLAGGPAVRLPALDGASQVGPGGRSAVRDASARTVTLRGHDGRALRTVRGDRAGGAPSEVTWSADGRRVALVAADRLLVLDADGGRVLTSATIPGEEAPRLSAQAFAPDGTALVATAGDRVLRVDVATGTAVTLDQVPVSPVDRFGFGSRTWRAVWGAGGTIAAVSGDRLRVLGTPPLEVKVQGVTEESTWSPDGTRLLVEPVLPDCAAERTGISTLAPGAAPVTLLAPTPAPLLGLPAWSPDGALLAVAVGRDPNARGARRPWPRRAVPRDFAMVGAAGDRAVRRAVVRAIEELRRGATRSIALHRLGAGLRRAERRHPEAGDSAVRERVADAVDPWLRSAGFAPIDGLTELDC